ncbi:kinase R-like protein, partial [Trifolium pratense]
MLKNCNRHIQVPAAGEDFPEEDDYHVFFERGILEKGLNEGFEVEYIVEDEECLKCLGSDEGDCKWKNNNDIEKHVKS